jgi:diacylglycerol kinase (ATP)
LAALTCEEKMRRRFLVLFNPGAGRSRRALLAAVTDRLLAANATIIACDEPDLAAATEKAVRYIKAGDIDAVVAAGGDGTVRHAARLVVNSDMPLGYVPLGTGNVLAHELNLKRTPDAIVEMLLSGPQQTVECGVANGALFLLMVGVGFDGRVIGSLNTATKMRFGKFAYVPPVLSALWTPRDELAISIDNKPYAANWIVVANARHYGGHFVVARDASITTSGFQAVLFRARSVIDLTRQLVALSTGRLARMSADAAHVLGVETINCRDVSISSNTTVPCQIDGDTASATPMSVSTGGGRVQLIVPQG